MAQAQSSPTLEIDPRQLIVMLAMTTAIGPFSTDMYLPAIPTLARDLDTSIGAAQLSIALFFAGLAAGQLLYGPVSDRIGRKPPLLGGLLLYVIASFGCAMAPNLEILCLFRLLQALGACAGVVIARAVVRDRFADGDLMHVLAWMTAITSVSPILAPVAGGWLLLVASWRWLFAIQMLTATLLAAMIWRFLPETRSARTEARARSESILGSYAVALGGVDLRRFLIIGMMAGLALYGWVAAAPDVVINQFGMPAQNFAYVFGTNTMGFVIATQINARLGRKVRLETALRWIVTAAVGLSLTMLVALGLGVASMWFYLIGIFFIVAALGCTIQCATAGAIATEPERAGTVASLIGAVLFGGGFLGAVLTATLHDDTLFPVFLVMTLATACARLHVAKSERIVAPG